MSIENCIPEVEAVTGPLTDEQKTWLGAQMGRLVRKVVADENASDLAVAAEALGRQLQAAEVIRQRNTALNFWRRTQMLDYVWSTFRDAPDIGLKALITGTQVNRQGVRNTVEAAMGSRVSHYHQGWRADLYSAGLMHKFASGIYDLDIRRAVAELAKPEPKLDGIPKEAVEIARINKKWMDYAVAEANRAGASIGRLDDYAAPQHHDQGRILREGQDAWVAFMVQNLDWKRTMPDLPPDRREAELKRLYTRFASGEHLKLETPDDVKPDPTAVAFKGMANLGKRLSNERVLHFAGPEQAHAYNERFGSGGISDAVHFHLETLAKSTALMDNLGPNAEANLFGPNGIVKEIMRRLEAEGRVKDLQRVAREAYILQEKVWPVLTGASSIPVNRMAAEISSNVLQVQRASKLPFAGVLSFFVDPVTYASSARYQGRGFLSGWHEAIDGVAKSGFSESQRHFLSNTGVALDQMTGSMLRRIDEFGGVPGRATRYMNMYMEFIGLRHTTDQFRGTSALVMGHDFAHQRASKFADLTEERRRLLTRAGIDEGKWDLWRKTEFVDGEGRSYLDPEDLKRVPDEDFAEYLKAKGLEPTEARVRELRRETTEQLRSMFWDSATTTTSDPGIRERALWTQGTRDGTFWGIVLRQVGLFKGTSTAFVMRTLAREIYGYSPNVYRGASGVLRAIQDNQYGMNGLAQMLVGLTIAGYVSMSITDVLKGKKPRDPLDPRTIFAAMAKGGAAGIYGDYLFGEVNKTMGGNIVSAMMGPTANDFASIADIYGRFRGIPGEEEGQRAKDYRRLAADAFSFAYGHVPNLFYTKAALDYLFGYQVRETLSPGYLRRMEQRELRENERAFFLPPSQAIPYGGGNRLFEGVR